MSKSIWPDRLQIRDTGIYNDLGGMAGRIYTTTGHGYEVKEYVRGDIAAELNILANGNQHTIDALQEMLFKQDAKIKRVREVVLAHCSDLLRCAALLDRYPRFVNTSKEIQKAAMRLVMVLEDKTDILVCDICRDAGRSKCIGHTDQEVE